MAGGEPPASDEERVRLMMQVIEEVLDDRWSEIDRLWMQEVRPAFGDGISDEDFMRRVAVPLSMQMLSIGLQAGIEGITRHADVFEKPFDVVVAPSGQVSIRFRE